MGPPSPPVAAGTRPRAFPQPCLAFACALLALLAALAGCTGKAPPAPAEPEVHAHCADLAFSPTVLFLAEGHTLANQSGPAAQTPGDDASEAFVSDPAPWDSEPLPAGLQVAGNVTFDLWVRLDGATPFPADPTDPSSPGTAARFYLQFGSDRALASGAVREEGPAATAPGTVVRVNASLALPEGGFTAEAGDRLRLVLVSLATDANGPGTTMLHGGDTPSQVRFASRCSEPRDWLLKRQLDHKFILPASQGTFTAAVPPQEGVNRLTYAFDLEEGTSRLTVQLRQEGCARVKCDMDLRLLDGNGAAVAEAGSPFANETLVLWPENLEAFLPPGGYRVQVDAYGGANYSGKLSIAMHESEGHLH